MILNPVTLYRLMTTKIGIIFAHELDIIGINNNLPWKLKHDLYNFKKLTDGNIVIMGLNTWKSLPKKPLPNRINIVVSTTSSKSEFSDYQSTFLARDLEQALLISNEFNSYYINKRTVWIIGGSNLLTKGKSICTDIAITKVRSSYTTVSKSEDCRISAPLLDKIANQKISYLPAHVSMNMSNLKLSGEYLSIEELSSDRTIRYNYTILNYERVDFMEHFSRLIHFIKGLK
jgi:dihydrofolate reductase